MNLFFIFSVHKEMASAQENENNRTNKQTNKKPKSSYILLSPKNTTIGQVAHTSPAIVLGFPLYLRFLFWE